MFFDREFFLISPIINRAVRIARTIFLISTFFFGSGWGQTPPPPEGGWLNYNILPTQTLLQHWPGINAIEEIEAKSEPVIYYFMRILTLH